MNQAAASFRRSAWVCAWVVCVAAATPLAYALQQPNGNTTIVGVVVDENSEVASWLPRHRVRGR